MPKGPSASRPRHPRDQGRAPGLDELIALARRVTDITNCPVVGGIAVALYGGGRHTHVIDLIERVPLTKAFAAKLPTRLCKPFKQLCDQVHEPRRSPITPRDFRRR